MKECSLQNFIYRYLSVLSDERAAVLISGGPDLKTPKLLGIPIIPNSTGAAQHSAVFDLLEEWDALDNVVGLVLRYNGK
jgi:hypothetical protein